MNRRTLLAGMVATAAGLLVPEAGLATPARRFWALDRTMVPAPVLRLTAFGPASERWEPAGSVVAYDIVRVDGEPVWVESVRQGDGGMCTLVLRDLRGWRRESLHLCPHRP